MMIVKQMFEVIVDKQRWRISEDNVETFIHICLFNDKSDITIKKERKP